MRGGFKAIYQRVHLLFDRGRYYAHLGILRKIIVHINERNALTENIIARMASCQ